MASLECLLNIYRSQVNSTNLDCRDGYIQQITKAYDSGSHMDILLTSIQRQALVRILFADY